MSDGKTQRDPADDPNLCSHCGTYIGFSSEDYCDPCARELGVKPPMERCLDCGQRAPQEEMESIDVSQPDEYYPEIRYLCPGCSDRGVLR